MRTVGLVLARAGSAGLPDKNILPLLEKPVVAYTLDAACGAERLDFVAVTSDSPEVLALARSRGVAAIGRPRRLATARAHIRGAIEHALRHLDKKLALAFDAVAVLYGNVPVRPEGIIDRCIDLMEKTAADCVKTFVPVGKFHPLWMSKIDADGVVSPYEPTEIYRRQELPPVYVHDGAVLLIRTANLTGRSGFFGRVTRAVLCDPSEVVDIDSRADFFAAEAALRARTARKR